MTEQLKDKEEEKITAHLLDKVLTAVTAVDTQQIKTLLEGLFPKQIVALLNTVITKEGAYKDNTLLSIAIRINKPDVIKALLKPLSTAEKITALTALVPSGVYRGYTSAYFAAKMQQTTIQGLLDGLPLTAKTQVVNAPVQYAEDHKGATLLSAAALTNADPAVITELLKGLSSKSKLEVINTPLTTGVLEGMTPLHCGVVNNNGGVVESLLANLSPEERQTAIHTPIQSGKYKGKTALNLAQKKSNALLALQPDAVYLAAEKGQIAKLQFLLQGISAVDRRQKLINAPLTSGPHIGKNAIYAAFVNQDFETLEALRVLGNFKPEAYWCQGIIKFDQCQTLFLNNFGFGSDDAPGFSNARKYFNSPEKIVNFYQMLRQKIAEIHSITNMSPEWKNNKIDFLIKSLRKHIKQLESPAEEIAQKTTTDVIQKKMMEINRDATTLATVFDCVYSAPEPMSKEEKAIGTINRIMSKLKNEVKTKAPGTPEGALVRGDMLSHSITPKDRSKTMVSPTTTDTSSKSSFLIEFNRNNKPESLSQGKYTELTTLHTGADEADSSAKNTI